jgi:hypothetical protein
MTSRLAALASALLLTTATHVSAQSMLNPPPPRPTEFLIGGLVAGPASLGTTTVELLGANGEPSQTFVRFDNKTRGYGLEVGMGVELRRSLWLEVIGGWTRASVISRVRNDFENAESLSVSTQMSRFLVEGAVLRYFNASVRNAWFVRGSAGWMREAAGGATLTDDGIIAGGGLGFRHWWRTAGKGGVKRLGLRLEGRALIRSGGISLGESGVKFGPAGTVHLVFGY